VEDIGGTHSGDGTWQVAPPVPDVQRRPGRFVRSLSDERLVSRVRSGDEAAFEAIYDRHHRGLLSFCRHMLGDQQEAEDAVQHTFIAAYRSLVSNDRDILLKAWLYAIARNRSLSVLRARREHVALDDVQPATEGLAAEVERRQDLKDLLSDLQRLPDDQRAALVLSEIGAHTHEEIAVTLDVPTQKVKALVFQARTSIAGSRDARDTPCHVVQEQLATLRGGQLRRTQVRRHVSDCLVCQAFKAETQRQRAAMAIVLPVVPALTLKGGVLGATTASAAPGAAGAGGGGAAVAAGGASAAAGGASAVGGVLVASAVVAGALKGTLMKAVVTAALASSGAGGYLVIEHVAGQGPEPAVAGFDAASAVGPVAAARLVAGGVGLSARADVSADALALKATPYGDELPAQTAQLPLLTAAPQQVAGRTNSAGQPGSDGSAGADGPAPSTALASLPGLPSVAGLPVSLPSAARAPSARRILSGAAAPPVVRTPQGAADLPVAVPGTPLPPLPPVAPVPPAPLAPVAVAPPVAPVPPTSPDAPALPGQPAAAAPPPVTVPPVLAPPAVPTVPRLP
jgi:RNA polymerase sigma factor (sigma-70 family)